VFWPSFLISPRKALASGSLAAQGEDAEGPCLIPLEALQLGQCGLVRHLELNESDDKRLRTMGICPGRRVWLVRRGDPMVLKVMGTRIGLAAVLAKQVTVEVCAPPYEGFQDIPPIRLEREPGEPREPQPGEAREAGA
jgi:ferrous iron transport protein A